MANKKYDKAFKETIARLNLEEGRTLGSLLRQRDRQLVYQFIDLNKAELGVRWLLRRFEIFPNAYYNYRKFRKVACDEHRQLVQNQFKEIYHSGSMSIS